VRLEPAVKNSFVYDRVQNLKLKSRLMAREMPYRVVLPEDYSNANETIHYPVVYLLHGLSGHFDNWTDKTKVLEYSKKHRFIIVMPEGGDGWYTDSSTVPNDKHESYIIQELIPEVERMFRVRRERAQRIIAGLSMGGYGALKFGLKFAYVFSVVGSFSGALDAPLHGQDHKTWSPSIMSVFGPVDSTVRTANDVFAMVKAIPSERLKSLPFFYISCGTDDTINFQWNQDLATLLVSKKIPHEYRHFPGTHSWAVWDDQVGEFLDVAERKLPK
jgi:S-formylglutathione hydrolase FrmB